MEGGVPSRIEKLSRRCQRHVRRSRDTLAALGALLALWVEEDPGGAAWQPWWARHRALEDLLRALEAYSLLEPALAAEDLRRLQARSWRCLQGALLARAGGPLVAAQRAAELAQQRARQDRRQKTRRRFFALHARTRVALRRLEAAAPAKHSARVKAMQARLAALERKADTRPAKANQAALKLEKKVRLALARLRR